MKNTLTFVRNYLLVLFNNKITIKAFCMFLVELFKHIKALFRSLNNKVFLEAYLSVVVLF